MDTQHMHLKLIGPEDFGLLSRLLIENDVPAVIGTFDPFPMTAETADWMACQPRQDKYYLALSDAGAVGFSMLRGWEEGFAVPSFGMFVDHRHQGQGFGKQILDLTIQEARHLGCERIRLSVFSNNPVAWKMYISRGFQETQRTTVEHQGANVDRIIMLKELLNG